MKYLIFIIVIFVTQFSLAGDSIKSQMMEETMLKAGVESFGKRQLMQASLSCKINRHNVFYCFLIAGTEYDSVSVEYFNEDAHYISNLLKSFGVQPEGRRLRQNGAFNCQYLKSKNNLSRTCELVTYDDVF